MRRYLILCLVSPLVAQDSTDRIIQVVNQDGTHLVELRSREGTTIRLTDQFDQSISLNAAAPQNGIIELINDQGVSVFYGKNIDAWAEQIEDRETRRLVQDIVLNVSKGIAIVIALLVLRSIVRSIGKNVRGERNAADLQQRIYELEAELANARENELGSSS